MFKTPSFEDAVKLFKQWGFQVEPGPQPEQVTLILAGPDYRACTVYEAHMLPQVAAVALRVRWQNGSMALRAWQRGTGTPVDLDDSLSGWSSLLASRLTSRLHREPLESNPTSAKRQPHSSVKGRALIRARP